MLGRQLLRMCLLPRQQRLLRRRLLRSQKFCRNPRLSWQRSVGRQDDSIACQINQGDHFEWPAEPKKKLEKGSGKREIEGLKKDTEGTFPSGEGQCA